MRFVYCCFLLRVVCLLLLFVEVLCSCLLLDVYVVVFALGGSRLSLLSCDC